MRRRRIVFRRPAECYPRYYQGYYATTAMAIIEYIRAFERLNHLKETV